MATTSQPKGLFPATSTVSDIKSTEVPVILLIQLLEAVGGVWKLDGYDLFSDPPQGQFVVEKPLDPAQFIVRWVEE